MLKNKVALAVLSLVMASCVGAEPTAEVNIRKNLEPKLQGRKVEGVRQTPVTGLYEVRITGGGILYSDRKGEYVVEGSLIDVRVGRNLTQERMEELNKISFSDLPLDAAMKQVKGDGKRVVAIFEDPNCGYCKQLRQTTLKDLDNVTIYTFMYNILREDSFVKSKNIWCSPDRVKAWDDWMVSGKLAPDAPADCKDPNDVVSELGRKLRISGTPAIFFADGTRLPGAVDLKTMEAKFATLKQ